MLVPVAHDPATRACAPSAVSAADALFDPVPPCATDSAVVSPVSDVMSLFAPLFAAESAVRADVAVVEPVPPRPIASGVVNPPSAVMSVLKPLDAAPRL